MHKIVQLLGVNYAVHSTKIAHTFSLYVAAWFVRSTSDLFLVVVGLQQSCPLSLISRWGQVAHSFWFGGLKITSVLCADDVVLLVSSIADLQLALEQFASHCDTSRTRISTLKSEAMVICQSVHSGRSWSPKWKS